MQNSFFMATLVNGRAGDPALFVDLAGLGKAVLMDAGSLDRLSPARILRVTHVFVSHAHVDHFIGFDHMLRVALGHDVEIRLFGPEGFLCNLEGKLAGYTWNLVEGSALKLVGSEISGSRLLTKEYACGKRFAAASSPAETALEGLMARLPGGIEARCAVLDHGIPSVAYSLREPDRLNVDQDALRAAGMKPGPWLAELKEAVRAGTPPSSEIEADGRLRPIGEIAEAILVRTSGEMLTYVADCAPTPANAAAIVGLALGSDVMYCEGAYLDADADKAEANRHLTAAFAGRVARAAGVRRLEVFHFSPRYVDRFPDLEKEAQSHFLGRPSRETGS